MGSDGRPRPFHLRVRVPKAAESHQHLIRRIIDVEKPAYVNYGFDFVPEEALRGTAICISRVKISSEEKTMGQNRNWQKAPNDNYQEWLLKSIPSETIELYLGIHAFLLQWQGRPDAVMWVFLGICVAATPFFLYKGGIKRPTQYIIATLAVPIWAMSIP